MISAFSQKISELESKLEKNIKNIGELQCHVKSKETNEETEKETHPSEIQRILLSFQGELKDQSFMVNTLQSRVYCHQEELRALRTYVQEKIAKEDEIENLKKIVNELCARSGKNEDKADNPATSSPEDPCQEKSKRTKPVKLNPEVPEFKPRFLPQPTSTSRQMEDTSTNSKVLGSTALETSMINEHSSEDSAFLNDFDPEQTDLMQQKLFEKDCVVLEAEHRLEESLAREGELGHQLAWADHKIRLLKHDKRRRGETIGKLLRCIDDLRDVGRLDLNLATSERAILTTTLSTRGMPHDERIQVAINVTEAERLHQYCPDKNSPRFGPDGMETSSDICDVMMPDSPSDSQCSSLYSSIACSPHSFAEPEVEI